MYELVEFEIDAVTGGQGNGNGNAFGLVAAGLSVQDILNGTLNGNTVNVLSNGVSIAVPIGIAVSVAGVSANALRA